MKETKIRTVIVDDETRALNRMKILLNNFPEIEILEQLSDSEHAINFILQNEPDLVLLDIDMPEKPDLK